MNFFGSDQFLKAIHAQNFRGDYYPEFENVEIDGHVLRLLVLKQFQNSTIVTEWPFLDYHQPIAKPDVIHRKSSQFAPSVALDVIRLEDDEDRPPKTELAAAPYIQLDECASYAEYCEDWLTGSRFKDDARRRRQAEKEFGEIVFTVDDTEGFAFYNAYEWKRQQFPENATFNKENLEFLSSLRPHLTVSTLRAKGAVVASWIGFIHEGAWSGWIFSINPSPEYKKFSFGRQLLYSMIEHAYTLRLAQFDFSIGDEDYKWYFATHARLCGPIGKRSIAQRIAVGAHFLNRNIRRLVRPAGDRS